MWKCSNIERDGKGYGQGYDYLIFRKIRQILKSVTLKIRKAVYRVDDPRELIHQKQNYGLTKLIKLKQNTYKDYNFKGVCISFFVLNLSFRGRKCLSVRIQMQKLDTSNLELK